MNTNNEFKAIAELDLDLVKTKLMHAESGEGWLRQRADAVEFEYRRFLLLMKKFPEEVIAPSVDVDSFWHYHILDTQKYAIDCQQIFGYFLHHDPYLGLSGEQDQAAQVQAGSRMREIYEATFGNPASECSAETTTAWCAGTAGAAWCAGRTTTAWCAGSQRKAANGDSAWCATVASGAANAGMTWCAAGSRKAANDEAAWCAAKASGAAHAGVAWCAAVASSAPNPAPAWCAAKSTIQTKARTAWCAANAGIAHPKTIAHDANGATAWCAGLTISAQLGSGTGQIAHPVIEAA